MKPSWDDAPEWAQWLAVDSDGYWYWYEKKPESETEDCMWVDDGGKVERAFLEDWRLSLEERPNV